MLLPSLIESSAPGFGSFSKIEWCVVDGDAPHDQAGTHAGQQARNRMMPTASRVLFVALIAVYCLTGCSVLHPRKPLPAELANIASPTGYHDIRDWGDVFSPTLQRSIQVALRAEAA